MDQEENTRFLYIEKEKLIFHFINNGQTQDEIVLKAGYQFIANTFFKHKLPSEAETEYAINYIEDELMSNKRLICNDEKLIIKSQVVKDLFTKYNINQNVILRQEIEDLFSEFASAIMRKNSFENSIEIFSGNFAMILLIREITHHLKFSYIII